MPESNIANSAAAPSSALGVLDVLIVGGGPAGLAAAIAARRRGLTYVVIEKGALVNSLLHYPPDMVFFTTPELLEIGGLPFVSPYEKPTRQEALRYYRRVTDTFGLDVRFDEPVVALSAPGGVFAVVSQPRLGPPVHWTARAVVIATGAYDVPNRIDVPGEDLPHVSHYYAGPHAGFRRDVVIVGGKNSAAEAALDLFRAGARVRLVHRGHTLGDSIKYWVRPDIENRIKEGSVAASFDTRVTEITGTDVAIEGPGGPSRVPADLVFLMTGYRSDTSLLRAAGAAIDEAIGAPVHDPETYETTVPNLFLAGAVVAGRQSGRIFIENGRFHGELVIGEIAQRLQPDPAV
jgi:thioredoxin reductase (NADPH)